MTDFIQSIPASWISAVSMTLLHSVWQGLIIVLLLNISLYLAKSASSSIRYTLSVLALLALSGSTFTTFYVQMKAQDIAHKSELFTLNEPFVYAYEGDKIASIHEELPENSVEAVTLVQLRARLWLQWSIISPKVLPVIASFWVLGALLCSLRCISSYLYIFHIRARLLDPTPKKYQHYLANLCEKMGIRRTVSLYTSGNFRVPITIGQFKPIIVLPLSILTLLTPAQIEAIIAHELAHIKRHDFLVNMLQTWLEIVFFYHPAFWWINRNIHDEREYCCDDIVVNMTDDAMVYARALTEIGSINSQLPVLALAAKGKKFRLFHRIQRILTPSSVPSISLRYALVSLIGLALIFGLAWKRVQEDSSVSSPLPVQRIDAKLSDLNPASTLQAEHVILATHQEEKESDMTFAFVARPYPMVSDSPPIPPAPPISDSLNVVDEVPPVEENMRMISPNVPIPPVPPTSTMPTPPSMPTSPEWTDDQSYESFKREMEIYQEQMAAWKQVYQQYQERMADYQQNMERYAKRYEDQQTSQLDASIRSNKLEMEELRIELEKRRRLLAKQKDMLANEFALSEIEQRRKMQSIKKLQEEIAQLREVQQREVQAEVEALVREFEEEKRMEEEDRRRFEREREALMREEENRMRRENERLRKEQMLLQEEQARLQAEEKVMRKQNNDLIRDITSALEEDRIIEKGGRINFEYEGGNYAKVNGKRLSPALTDKYLEILTKNEIEVNKGGKTRIYIKHRAGRDRNVTSISVCN